MEDTCIRELKYLNKKDMKEFKKLTALLNKYETQSDPRSKETYEKLTDTTFELSESTHDLIGLLFKLDDKADDHLKAGGILNAQNTSQKIEITNLKKALFELKEELNELRGKKKRRVTYSLTK